MIPRASTRRFWETRATALAWRINAAAWLDRVAPVCFFVASAIAIALYALRRAQTSLAPAWIALGCALAAAALVAWWRARRAFYRPVDARVLLEAQLRLDTRLTAADLGLVAWPAEPAKTIEIVHWRLRVPAGWTAGALALLVLAIVAPVPRGAAGEGIAGPPPALLQTEEMLAALKEMNIADPHAIERLEQRAGELARRPSDEQYSHSALEAADALRNQTAVSAAELARGLDSAAGALDPANNRADMKNTAGQLAAALSGLRDGAMPANPDLLANLPASALDLSNLTPEQRAQLSQQLAAAAQGLKGIAGAAGAGAEVAKPDPNAPPGRYGGGLGGGGDTAPLMLSSQPSDAGDGRGQALSADALKRFALGDKLGMTNSTHELDPHAADAPTSAGAIAAPAAGGEAVWVNRLTPAERAALKDFFK